MGPLVPHSPQRQVTETWPYIAESLDQWPENMPLGVQPTMQELTDAIRSLANGKAVGPEGVIDSTHARGKVLRALMRIDVDRIALIS